ncbi:MAG: serine/threonine protein kinase [Myxococcales bacterium]|nr:serine/threonine protein kinase [Myxococcales bacterium]
MPDSRYRITERVAAGGMAEVFRGVAESLQGFKKNIAIKRILPALTKNKKFVAMFLDEARLSLLLQHTNIVQVFDIGHTDDTYFIVMEYVDGVDLKALTEWRRKINRRIPIAHTLYVTMEICKGLSYAHELQNPDTGKPLGIVHRDISPPNVLISKQGEIKVVDFGLAKATSQIETTDPGVVKGKMSYLSPEAARGEEVDSTSDIFAVGILLYEMLTGKRLFYGETDYQTVELVRTAKVPPIKPQNPQVEPELEDIVRKALAKRKEDRFQGALDLQDALAQYSYSRGLKVISRDIAELVRQCIDDRNSQSSDGTKKSSIIDHMLQEEIVKITSVDFEDPGAKPLSADDLALAGGDDRPSVLDEGDFIDPRAWSEERHTPSVGLKTVDEIERRVGVPVAATSSEPRPSAGSSSSAQAPGNVTGTGQTGTGQTASGQTMTAQAAAARKLATPAPPFATALPGSSSSLAASVGAALGDRGLGGPTPGPESLASVLEPSSVSVAPPRPSGKAGRSFFIGAIIGVVLLGGAVAALMAKKNASAQAQPAHSSAP